MLVKENQQATASWVSGIIEGEGHFEKRSYDFFRLHISNCDLDIITACEQFLTKNNILFTRYQETKKTKGSKTAYRILVSSQDCCNLYRILSPFLHCRKEEYQKIVGASETTCDTSLIDLQWLIGIWQAEGTFYITRNAKGIMIPYISLENTNSKIITKIVMNLKELGLSWYCKDFVPTVKKPYTRISIFGMQRCQRFLRKTENLWIGKRDLTRTNLMLEYINSRLSKAMHEKYNDRETQIYHLLKDQNK
jgi:hypothetical protein